MSGRAGDSGPAAVLVSWVGEAEGSRPVAAALACAGSDPDRAALLLELTDGRAPHPALVASAAARALEERLAVHLPEAVVASRGALCHLTLPAVRESLDRVPAALPLVRDSLGVVLVPPGLLQAATETPGLRAGTVVLRADLGRDRALTALAARDLIARGVAVAVAKRPLPWVPSRRALFGALPADAAGGLPARMLSLLSLGA
jgi:hypothetical protein